MSWMYRTLTIWPAKFLLWGALIPLHNLVLIAAFTQAQEVQEAPPAQETSKYRAPQASDGSLVWKLKPGQELKVVSDQKMTMNMDMSFQKVTTESSNFSESTWKVTEVDSAGNANTEMTIDRMKLIIDNNGNVISYDSDSSEEVDAMLASIVDSLESLIGKPIRCSISPRGEVSNVVVPKELSDEQDRSIQSSLMSEQTIKELIKNSMVQFPGLDLKIGDTWEQTTEVDMGMFAITNRSQYRYLGVEDRESGPLHVIEVVMTQEFNESDSIEIEITEQNSKSMVYFDGIKGNLVESTMDQNVKMVIAMMDQQIAQQVKQQMKVKISSK